MSHVHPHHLAEEFSRARFLSDSSAAIELILLQVVEAHAPVEVERIQQASLLSRPQIHQALEKLVQAGDVQTSGPAGAETYQMTARGGARLRFLLVDYYHELRRMETQLVQDVTARLRKLVERGVRLVALYPVGETAEVVAQALGAAGMTLVMAVDDAPGLWETSFHGVAVRPPAELADARLDAVILTTCVFQDQLRKQLEALHLKTEIISF